MDLNEIVAQKRHHGRGCFLNPFGPRPNDRLLEAIRWRFFSRNHFRHYYSRQKVTPVSFDWTPVKTHPGLSVTYLNHASVLIREPENTILVDPVFFGLPFFIKDFSPLKLGLETMPKPNRVLITHGHYDHLDLPSLKSLSPDTELIMPLGYDKIVATLSPRPITQLDWLEEYDPGDMRITLLPCNHWSMRNPLAGPNRSLWGSYLVRIGGRTIYISGDTAYFEGFRAIGEMADIELAIINVGAFEPRWFMKNSHMNPAEAVRAFRELGAKQMLAVHWGSFRLGDEPVYLPLIMVKEEMARAGLADRLVELRHGETLYYD